MTIEEKAREIAKKNYSEMLTVNRQYIDSEDDCYDSALEMAVWKDQQFEEVIAQLRKWLYEHGKLDKGDLVEFDMEMEKLLEKKK